MTRPSRFEGTIGRTVDESAPWFDEPPHPGEGAPDVVVVLLDDTGFAQFGCYGSDIDTPNVDTLAAGGLQFTNFHVTPLCSPTRASLLTGRSQHASGCARCRTSAPGSRTCSGTSQPCSDDGRSARRRRLRHVRRRQVAPRADGAVLGGRTVRPVAAARGFDRFYGFLEGETDQFHPELVIDNHASARPPASPRGLPPVEDLVDQALRMVSDSVGVRPDRPFFTYLAFGATHAPHQAPPEYLAKYRGRFDEGWDVVRQRWFGVKSSSASSPTAPAAPATRASTPGTTFPRTSSGWRPGCRKRSPRSSTTPTSRSAGSSTDSAIGQTRQHGADGARRQRGIAGGRPVRGHARDEVLQRDLRDPDKAVERIDDIGGPHSHTNYPWGWAQCGNTPFKWYKQNTHEGGVHVPDGRPLARRIGR